ncbi:hemolysin activation protein [Mesorhizobium sp. L48C026A00]|nr:hemolysin activation protein [Mesorhizobium sp. L48C026A00]
MMPETVMPKPNIPQQAVILAAGYGSRLRPFTDYRPKPLVEVNGVAILHNALAHLDALGVREVTIVVGYRKDAIEYACGGQFGGLQIRYVESTVFATTGSAWSLWLAREALLAGDLFLLEGDVFFERAALERLAWHPAPDVAAVAPFTELMEGSAVVIDEGGAIHEVRMKQTAADLRRPGPPLFKTMNLLRFSAQTLRDKIVPALDAYADAGHANVYTEQMLAQLIADAGLALAAARCDDLRWYEIDTADDLRIAEGMFSKPALRSASAGHIEVIR